jgi:hypothetical protein
LFSHKSKHNNAVGGNIPIMQPQVHSCDVECITAITVMQLKHRVAQLYSAVAVILGFHGDRGVRIWDCS